MNIIEFPFRLTWNILIIIIGVAALIAWNVFIWGSVIVGVLFLIFAPGWLLWPILIFNGIIELWPER